MKADSHYEIGATHSVCQDRVLHGSIPGSTNNVLGCSYVIGCDGCSSSNKSELGAAILCELGRKHLEQNAGKYYPGFTQFMIQETIQLVHLLKLDMSAFDATFWLLTMNEQEYSLSSWGDGVFFKEYSDGSNETTHVEFTSGAPRYLSYGMSGSRYEGYLKQFGDAPVKVHKYENHVLIKTDEAPVDKFGYSDLGQVHDPDSDRYLTRLSILSDGALTYHCPATGEALSLPDLLTQLLAFKTNAGTFVQRRMKTAALDFAKRGIVHNDDIFCGTIANV